MSALLWTSAKQAKQRETRNMIISGTKKRQHIFVFLPPVTCSLFSRLLWLDFSTSKRKDTPRVSLGCHDMRVLESPPKESRKSIVKRELRNLIDSEALISCEEWFHHDLAPSERESCKYMFPKGRKSESFKIGKTLTSLFIIQRTGMGMDKSTGLKSETICSSPL